MALAVLDREPVVARDDEISRIELLRQRIEEIHRLTASEESATHGFTLIGPDKERIDLPESVGYLLRQIIQVLAQGEAVSIVPVQKELTTQQSADLLNVSRQHVVNLLEAGEIPFHKTGTHRRIRFGDLMEYRRRRDANRNQLLDKLDRLGEELDYE